MAPTKSTAFNIDCVEPVASSTGAPAAAPTDDISVLPQSGYLTADWVKRRYSISNSTLYKWIAEGHFPAPVKIGPRAVRWASVSLRKFEASLVEGGH